MQRQNPQGTLDRTDQFARGSSADKIDALVAEIRRNFSDAQIERLATDPDLILGIRECIEHRGSIKLMTHSIDCGTLVSCSPGWEIPPEYQMLPVHYSGVLEWNKEEQVGAIHVVKRNGNANYLGKKAPLVQELFWKGTYPANVGRYLVENPVLIPKEWCRYLKVFFFGTIFSTKPPYTNYSGPRDLYVMFIEKRGGKWQADYLLLDETRLGPEIAVACHDGNQKGNENEVVLSS